MHNDNNPIPESSTRYSIWNSLRFSLFAWFLLLSLTPVMVASVLDYYQTKNSLNFLAQKELKQSANLGQKFVDNWFNYLFREINIQAQMSGTAELFSTYKTNRPHGNTDLSHSINASKQKEIRDNNQKDLLIFKKNLEHVNDVLLIDLTGDILFTFNKHPELRENINTGKYANTKFSNAFNKTIESRKTTFFGIERYTLSNNLISGFLSSPIFDSNDKLIGVFAVQVSIDGIFDAFKTTANEDRSIKHYLVGTDRLLRTPINNNWDDVLHKEINTINVNQWLQTREDSSTQPSFEVQNYNGPNSRVIGTHRTIRAGDIDWLLVSEMNEDDALSASTIMLNTMLITVICMIIIVFVISYFVTKRLTRPITALVQATTDFAQGKSNKIQSNNSSNEINRLITSFNTMFNVREKYVEQLKDSKNDVQRALELLEEQKYALDQHSIVAITDIKGTITFANQKFLDISGYELEELLGSNHRILNSGTHELLFWKNMFKTVSSGKTWRSEVCNKAKDGSLYWVDTTIIPFMDKNKRPQSYIAIRTDITHKKLTEFALAESSSQLKLIIESAYLGIWDWGIEANTISFNERWAEIIGYTLAELEPVSLDTWLANTHPDSLAESSEKLEQYWSGAIPEYSIEAKMKHKSGQWVWVYSSGKVVSWTEDHKPSRMVGIHLEITDRKNAESALAKSEAQSRGIFDSVADGIISLNSEGCITALNPAGEKIFQYNNRDIIGKSITSLMPEPYRAPHTEAFHTFQKVGEGAIINKVIEVEGLRSDGSIFPLELAISEVKVENEYHFTAMMRDISERKTIEKQQNQQHELIQIKLNVAETLAEQMPMAKRSIKAFRSILTLQFLSGLTFSGVLIFENDENNIDDNTESLAWHSQDILEQPDQAKLKALAHNCLAQGKQSNGKICFIDNINDANYHYLIPIYGMGSKNEGLGTLVFSSENRLDNMNSNASILHEISDLFAATIVQNNARHLLKKASKIAEQNSHLKSEFLASMSHEIRTPMNGVLGMLGLLLNSKLNSDQVDKVHLAKSSAESLLTLINDILDFSKVEAGKLELELIDFDLRQMLGEFCDAMALNAQEKDLELILDVRDIEESMVKGDSGRIRQILTNLVSNAIKFTAKGEIVVRVSTTTNSNNTLSLSCSITDTGIGIPNNKIPFLFDKFTQVDASTTREYGGTGLGLAITKKLCILMGGDIHVSTELNQGSTFAFKVELSNSEKSTQVLPSFDIQTLNILVVDDNATNREVVNGQLTHWGAKVVEADSGQSAIACCENYALEHPNQMFDIALLDMQMPHMDGAELGGILFKRFNAMKLVMMTSISIKNDNQFYSDIGFSAFFTKPATTSDLFDTLAILSDDGETLKQANPLITRDYIKSLKRGNEKKLHLNTFTWPENTRLLIVEDNRINQHVALGILNEFNLTADIAANGLEAITAIQTAPDNAPYTLILMDCQMPEMDGYDATRAIRRGDAGDIHKNITIVAMTANAMEGDKEKCIKAGMDDYMTKPIESERLIETLQLWLIEKQGLSVEDFIKVVDDSVLSEDDSSLDSSSSNDQLSAKPIVDPSTLIWDSETALNRVRGNTQLLSKLISMYLEDMPGHIEELKQAVESNNVELSKRAAHSIRGASGNLYAYRMQELAKSIEKNIIENIDDVNFNDLLAIITEIENDYGALKASFENFLQKN